MMEHEWDTPENGQDRIPWVDDIGIDIDFRIESRENPEILTLSHTNDQEYNCPIHGNVSEIIKFDIEGENEIYCIRCWREWFRNRYIPLGWSRSESNRRS